MKGRPGDIVVGTIGLEHPHAAMYLQTLDALDSVGGIVHCDPSPDVRERVARASRKTVASYPAFDDLLARQDVSVVLVMLPPDATPGAIQVAVNAGKHVFSEKPGARSGEEFRPVVEALRAQDRFLGIAYLWRANPAILRMRELIRAGALGRLTSIELRMVTTQVGLRNPSHWLFKHDRSGGGILSWLGCHWLDLLRYLTGQEVVSVSALLGTLSGEAIDVEDVAAVSLRLSEGALATLHAGYLLPSGRPGYEGTNYDNAIILRGTLGTLAHRVEGSEHVVTLESTSPDLRTAPHQVLRFALPTAPGYGGAHGQRFLDDFLQRAVGGDGLNWASEHDALHVLEVLDAIYQSARNERVVHLAGMSG